MTKVGLCTGTFVAALIALLAHGCRQLTGLSDIELGAGGSDGQLLPLGGDCSDAGACESGICSDDVCCDATCEGVCVSCLQSQSGSSDGTCASIPAGEDPDGECGAATCGGGTSCAPAALWSRSFGGVDCEDHARTLWDGSGVVLALSHQSDIAFGADVELSDGASYDFALARLDEDGEPLASVDFGGAGPQLLTAMARTSDGNLFVCGELEGSLSFEADPLPAHGGRDVFVAELSSDLEPLWSTSLGSSVDDRCAALAVQSNGDVVLVAEVGPSATLDGATLSSVGGRDILAVRFTSGGVPVWSRVMGSSWDDGVQALQIVGQRVVVGGSVGGVAELGAGPLPHVGADDALLLTLDLATGEPVASATFGSTGSDGITALAQTAAGDLVACGHFSSGLDLGAGALAARGVDAFVASFDAELQPRWSRTFGGNDTEWGDRCRAMAARGEQIIVAGVFETDIDLGGGPLRARSGQDLFLAGFASTGEHLWSARFGEEGGSGWPERSASLSMAATGDLLLAGEHSGDIDLGVQVHTPVSGGSLCTGTRDVFVARLQNQQR